MRLRRDVVVVDVVGVAVTRAAIYFTWTQVHPLAAYLDCVPLVCHLFLPPPPQSPHSRASNAACFQARLARQVIPSRSLALSRVAGAFACHIRHAR